MWIDIENHSPRFRAIAKLDLKSLQRLRAAPTASFLEENELSAPPSNIIIPGFSPPENDI